MQDQIERIITPKDGESPQKDDGLRPLMPFPTSYVLTREREDELVEHAMRRLKDLESECGRDVCKSGDWHGSNGQVFDSEEMEGLTNAARSWMGKRELYDLTFKNEVGFRASLLGGVFAESNLVVPVARRITRQMIARAVNYFFSTDPWFAIYPVGEMDKVRADKTDRYIRWKMDQAKLKKSQELSIERAFIIGESVVRTAWANRGQIYKTEATVLQDVQGKDILGVDGDYILEDDLWIEDTIADPATGALTPAGLLVLKRDGKTPQPKTMVWTTKPITRKITHYKGPEAKNVHFKDFLCPLEAESIQEADCCIHLYDMPLMTLADQWKKSIDSGADTGQRVKATRDAINLLRTLASSGEQSKSAQNSADVDSSTKNGGGTGNRTHPVVEIAEFHLRYDADGDGILEDVMLVIDIKTKTPIFYDYEANVTADGLRPFTVVRVNEVPGRWYGIGSMEMFNTSQQIIDIIINRWNYGNSKSARVDFWNAHNTIEGRTNDNLELNWGGTYTPAPGKKAADCLESVYLENNTADQLQELAQFFMQLMMNESGIANANDGNLAGMDSTKLATGIHNIEKSGQELFSLHLGHIEPGVQEVLEKMAKLVFSNLDQLEVYRYFEDGEGGEGGAELMEINPGDISNMEIDTRILLTRYRGEQILESSIRAVQLVKEYYAEIRPEVQERTAELYQQMLKALQVSNAKKIIQPLLTPPILPGAGGGGLPDAKLTASAAAGKPRTGDLLY
jgi:hypothetical protein